MTVKTRFAPSPTGLLHIGNIRTALINWLYSRFNKGEFLLRIDDTDSERSKEEYVTQIKEDLKWLGLQWEDSFHQKDRFNEYYKVIEELKEKNFLYACYETKDELETKRKMLLSRGLPPIYDREALSLTKEQIAKYEAEGRKPHYRFKLEDKNIYWKDLVRGDIHFEGKKLSDPIVVREDGSLTYMLCTVIDDIYSNITHIVRGEDHITNTAMHIQFFEALGVRPPEFAHLSLIKSKEAKISKRVGGMDVLSLRKQGIVKEAINSLLSKIGSSDPILPYSSMEEIINSFDISKYTKSTAQYDVNELIILNHKILQKMSYAQVKDDLIYLGINIEEQFWESIKSNVNTLVEVDDWYKICHKEINSVDISKENRDFLVKAIDYLPEEPWDNETWSKWIEDLKKNLGRKGKELFYPLRMALTGQESGPELKFLLPLIGKEKVLERLNK